MLGVKQPLDDLLPEKRLQDLNVPRSIQQPR